MSHFSMFSLNSIISCSVRSRSNDFHVNQIIEIAKFFKQRTDEFQLEAAGKDWGWNPLIKIGIRKKKSFETKKQEFLNSRKCI